MTRPPFPNAGSVCHHDVGVEVPCLECKIEWEVDCIASAEKSLVTHRARLAAFEGMRPSPPPSNDPNREVE